uniref:Uncharacterized protein n=1 Tax=Sipha flava TaxID=143950 RepID=A0A2S2QG54_9HEMI
MNAAAATTKEVDPAAPPPFTSGGGGGSRLTEFRVGISILFSSINCSLLFFFSTGPRPDALSGPASIALFCVEKNRRYIIVTITITTSILGDSIFFRETVVSGERT